MKSIIKKFRQKINLALHNTIIGDKLWYENKNNWEPPVLLCMRDLLKQGDVFFDVGANMGGLTTAASRLVGPKGIVCSFEASARIMKMLHNNIFRQNLNNITLNHRAVYTNSETDIKIFHGSHLNDSLYPESNEFTKYDIIKSISLDDYCNSTGLIPNLIKMDIEGAEFDALIGFQNNLKKHKPSLILEQTTNDSRCLDFLKKLNYVAFDLNTYKQINSFTDFPERSVIRNILYIDENKLKDTPYCNISNPFENLRHTINNTDFIKNNKFNILSNKFILHKGRYILDINLSATGLNNNLLCGVREYTSKSNLFEVNGYSKLISDSYREWVIEIHKETTLEVFFQFLDNTFDETFEISKLEIKIYQIPNFHINSSSYLFLD